jgi:aryl-alcohol dehydrogenase-like predicted oxidoreductase
VWLRPEARPPHLPAGGAVLGYVVRCRSSEEARGVREAPGTRPDLLAGPISLLRRELVGEIAAGRGEHALPWLARDPFAGGRLDGSWFEKALVSPPSIGPRPVRELETEFGPVARLRFLVLGGSRSLAQAAVRYVLDLPGVSWTSVPLPRVERWEEILRYDRSPPLDERDRAALDALA